MKRTLTVRYKIAMAEILVLSEFRWIFCDIHVLMKHITVLMRVDIKLPTASVV